MIIATIDLGNSNPHVGLFHQNGEIIKVIPYSEYTFNIKNVHIISSVINKIPNEIISPILVNSYFINHYFFEMPVNYGQTLGIDRLVCAYLAYQDKKLFKTLVIDAGTFMTMDFVSKKGFDGGFIFPGINTFLKSFQHGEKLKVLPFCEKTITQNDIPHNTEEAILNATNAYIESILEHFIKLFSPEKIIITGGHSHLIENKLRLLNSKVEVECDPHYLHRSLFLIYDQNLKDL